MKIYLSADIEGVTGTTHWDETEIKFPDYGDFREQMTAEVAAACEGALQAGASEVWVRDAHHSARNIIAGSLPEQTRLVRGWAGHPYMMMEQLDDSFQAAVMIGYHARAGSTANPLSHTITTKISTIKINGLYASEFMLNAYTAALAGVPVVFVSGDAGLCEEAAALIPAITHVAVKSGCGDSTINLHPQVALEKIRAGVQQALAGDLSKCRLELPKHFSVEMRYKEMRHAYSSSFYPGARLLDTHTIGFESDDYFDVLRLVSFTL